MRAKAIADGQQVEIPVLQYNRTVGTHVESISHERKTWYKRRRRMIGKSVIQAKDVMWSELK